mgnify:FL=1
MFVLGSAMWIPSILNTQSIVLVLITLALTIANSLLVMQFFYRSRITSLPSGFVASTWWITLSAIPMLHTCWQAQFVLAGIMLALIVLQKMDFHHEPTEEVFLATLPCCIVAVVPSIFYSGIMMLWGYLIAKQQMTWRVWFASLIAIAIRVIVMLVLHYCGWLEVIWMENIPRMTGMEWAVFGGVWLAGSLAILLPIRRPSMASGIYHMTYITLSLVIGILWHMNILYIH